MNCPERERLFDHTQRLLDQPEAARVRAHLEACPQCSRVVDGYLRLDSVLDEWTTVEPSPGFDARVRQAVETSQAGSAARGLWGLRWAGGLALASLGILLVAGLVWLTRSHRPVSVPATVATQSPRPTAPAPTPREVAKLTPPSVASHQAVTAPQPVTELEPKAVSSSEDEDAHALEDDDLVANFDLLSEIPKGEARVAN
jgi:hypothetical protein